MLTIYLKKGDELVNRDVLSKSWKTIVNLWHNINSISTWQVHVIHDTKIWRILKQAIFHTMIVHTDSSSSKTTKKHKVL